MGTKAWINSPPRVVFIYSNPKGKAGTISSQFKKACKPFPALANTRCRRNKRASTFPLFETIYLLHALRGTERASGVDSGGKKDLGGRAGPIEETWFDSATAS